MTKPEALGLNENAEVEKNNKMCERFLDVSSRNNRLKILCQPSLYDDATLLVFRLSYRRNHRFLMSHMSYPHLSR